MTGFKLKKGSIKILKHQLEAELQKKLLQGKNALRKVAEDIMAESLQEVPVDTGTLKSSAFIEEIGHSKITFGYGGPNDRLNPKTGQYASEYMYYVHEDLFARHTVGKAKFLEDPVRRNVKKIKEELEQAEVRLHLGNRTIRF